MNIHVWLNELDEYLDAKKINTDKQRQEIVL